MTSKSDQLISQLQQKLREKAESQLSQSGMKEMTSLEFDKILHELQVHQIELTMQNEELRRVQNMLEASRDRYASLYDFAPVSYFTVGLNDVIIECNLAAAELTGKARNSLVNQSFARLIADEEKDRWYLFHRQIQKDGLKNHCDTIIRRSDGSHIYVHLECIRMDDDDNLPVFLITLTDITSINLAKQALRIAAVAFETEEGIIVTDTNKVILQANKAFCRMTGFALEEVIGKTPSMFKSGLHDPKFYETLWITVANDGFWQGEIWDKRKDGELFPLLLNIAQVTDGDKRITHYVGCFTDITVQKRAENLLLNHKKHLEANLQNTLEELSVSKEEAEEVNMALNVLLKKHNEQLSDAKSTLSSAAEKTVLPFLIKLKRITRDKNELCLIGILEDNLKFLLASYGNNSGLSAI